MSAIKVTIEPVWTKSGYRYDIYHEGVLIVPKSKAPAGDASRWCAGVGKFGKLEVYRRGDSFPSMTAEIEHTAARTVRETETDGPRFVKWQPYARE
jgi:hypothetical protein